MAGIIPNPTSGAVTVRSQAGVCSTPAGVTNAYCPDAPFTSSCDLAFLPDSCDARIVPSQINAFQSEMLCLAEAFNPDGNWNCGSLCNLSANFNVWKSQINNDDTLWRDIQSHLCDMDDTPYATFQANALATWITCDGAGNVLRVDPPAFYSTPNELSNALCGNATALASLQACLDVPVAVTVTASGDGIDLATTVDTSGDITYDLTANPEGIATLICGSAASIATLNACLDTSGAVSSVTNTIAIGNPIATHNDGEGVATVIRETVTSVIHDVAANTVTFTNEAGTVTVVALGAGDTDVDGLTLAFDNPAGPALLTVTVTEGGNTLEADVPIATAITCDVDAVTGLTTDKWVSDFINQHYQARAGGTVANYTSTCSTAAYTTSNATVVGGESVAIAAQDVNIAGRETIGSGNGNVVINGRSSFITGNNNTLTGGNTSIVAGSDNNVSSAASFVTGGSNTTDTASVQVLVSGRDSTITTSTGVIVTGRDHTLTDSENTAVFGANHTLDSSMFNTVSGQNANLTDTNNSLVFGNNNTATSPLGTNNHSVLMGGHDNNFADAIDSVVFGARNTMSNTETTQMNTNDCVVDGIDQSIILGRFVRATNAETADGSIIGGVAGAGPALTSNRNYYLNGTTGDAFFAGAVTAGFVFPGFGEYFVNFNYIDQGYFVTTKDGINVEIAENIEDIIGITRNDLAVSAGGGKDPNNSEYLLDAFGSRVMEWVDVDVEECCGNTAKRVQVPVRNPDYDPHAAELPYVGVEFMGRTGLRVDKTVKPLDYVTLGKGGTGTKSKTQTPYRAMTVRDGVAMVLKT